MNHQQPPNMFAIVGACLLALGGLSASVPAQELPPEVAQAVREATGVDLNAQYNQTDEFNLYQLKKEDLVRWNNPRIKVALHPEWIIDAPPLIDKRTFRNPRGGRWAPNELYVRFKPGTVAATKDAAHARVVGAEVVWESEMVPDLYRVRFNALAVPTAVNAYLDVDEVLYAEPSYMQTPDVVVPNDPMWGDLWGMSGNYGIGAPWAWHETTGDQNFVVAVIDTGVEFSHADLLSNRWNNVPELNGTPGIDDDNNGRIDDFYGWNVYQNNNDVASCGNDHGTHVAGTIGARGNNGIGVVGVNWQCRIMALRCNGPHAACDPDGPGGDDPAFDPCCGLFNTIEALDYATDNGIKVSNNSYGSSAANQGMYDEILAGQTVGHLFVAAAGNDNADNDAAPHYPSSYRLANIISVAAIEEDGDRWECGIFCPDSGSNYGLTSVDLGAPGDDITSTTIGGYAAKTGTSMASPHVAGAVALVWSKHPQLTWLQIKARIMESTLATPELSGVCVTGGRLFVPHALGVWLNAGSGSSGIGTFDFPFPRQEWSLAYATTPTHGSLNLKPGAVSLANMGGATTLSKPMTLNSFGGQTVIGN